jgi:hypothetical protein
LCAARKWLWNAGRSARRSTKLNDETRRLGHSAKRNAAVRGQAGKGATVAGRRRPGAAEPIVGIFCLPGFVADGGPICSSRGSRPHFFPRVRDPSLSRKLKPSRRCRAGAELLLLGSDSGRGSERLLLQILRLGLWEERFHNCFFDAGTRKLESCYGFVGRVGRGGGSWSSCFGV